MTSVFRFLVFVALLAAVVSALYFWRALSLAESAESRVAELPVSVSGGFSTLAALDREFQSLIERVRPSVVSITAENYIQTLSPQGPRSGTLRLPPNLGSGVIVSPDGHIVTNLHVIQGAANIVVHLQDGRSLPAKVLGADPLTDIAILQIAAPELSPMPFGDSDHVRPGQIVFAVGNPYGLQETVTQGIISGIGRRSTSETVNEFFQTDTAINPGNSGGPLLNLEGEIIGINNAITSDNGGWQGIGFSIPSNTARRVFEGIVEHGRVIRTWLGITWAQPITPMIADKLQLPGVYGVLIHGVVDGSPAMHAGIQRGDVIMEFNGRQVQDGLVLRNRVAEADAGQIVPVKIVRQGRMLDLDVELQEFPET